MAIDYYKQCQLEKNNCIHVAWIPEKFAVKGAYVRIKENGTWEDGFIVQEAYATRMSHQSLIDKADMNRRFFDKDWPSRETSWKFESSHPHH